jgi:hypothetical protein
MDRTSFPNGVLGPPPELLMWQLAQPSALPLGNIATLKLLACVFSMNAHWRAQPMSINVKEIHWFLKFFIFLALRK